MSSPLRLVPYDPQDVSIGGVLSETTVEHSDSIKISAVMSLYFQWPEYRKCSLVETGGRKCLYEIEIDYDQDERVPTELWIKSKGKLPLEPFSTLRVSFEIFRQCFQFETRVLSVDHRVEGSFAVVEVPARIRAYAHRMSHRYQVPVENRLPGKLLVGNEIHDVNVTEIGLRSIRFETKHASIESFAQLQLRDSAVSVKLVRRDAETTIAVCKHESREQFLSYFQTYLSLAYPFLRRRKDYSPKEVLTLFENAGYFGKFSAQMPIELKAEIQNEWASLDASSPDKCVDFCYSDETGTLSGASGVCLAFRQERGEVWFFHQLCALTNPDLLAESGALYSWRAEYLGSLPGVSIIAVMFDGDSRWLERLYIKFFSGAPSSTAELKVIRYLRKKVTALPSKPLNDSATETLSYGTLKRYYTSAPVLSGVGPRYLNASGLFDVVIAPDSKDASNAEECAQALLAKAGLTTHDSFGFVLASDFQTDSPEWKDQKSNRLCTFSPEDMPKLISSIEHTVAVTRKKWSIKNAG